VSKWKTQPVTLEAQVADRPWRPFMAGVVMVGAFVLAFGVGRAAADGHAQIAILSVGGLASLAIFSYLRLPAWCSLLLVTAVAARGAVYVLGLPEVVNFLHYPVVLLFALAAADRPPRAASRAPGRWLVIFFLVVLLSAVAHPDVPTRAALFLLIAGEPFVVIWAISRWGADESAVRAVGVMAVLLAVIQIPIGVYQGLLYGWSDHVQGTLVGHGAGHHILGALFSLALFILIAAVLARRVNPIVGLIGAAVCLGMTLATGSMSVLVIASFAAILEPLIAPAGPHFGMRFGRRVGTVMLVGLVGASVLILVAAVYQGFYERARSLATSTDQPGLEIIWNQAMSDPLALLLGSGPGTSASRASLLLVDASPGSPLDFIGLEPTELGVELRHTSSNEEFGGSVESAASSALGVAGDLGLIGLAALAMLFIVMWKRAGRSSSWLAPAGRAALLMVAPLSLLDNWLEYPEFAIPFAILIGFVLSDAREWTENESARAPSNGPQPVARAPV
jgi:hypothetical protein